MISEGTESLSNIIAALDPLLQENPLFSFFSKTKLYLPISASDVYVDLVSEKSILIYVKQNTIKTNNSYMPLRAYSENLLAVDNFFTLIFLRNLPDDMKQAIEIHWIVVEKKESITKSIILSLLSTIDMLLERNGKNSVGRLDYENIEKLFNEVIGKKTIDKLFRHKNSTNIFSSLLNIFLSNKKNKYITKQDIANFNIESQNINDYKERIFRPICPVCFKKKSIVLNDSIIKGRYGKPDDIIHYIRKNKKVYAELICKSCRNISPDQLIFVRQVDKIPKTNVEKNISFLWVYKQYIEAEEGGFGALLTDEIITSMGRNDAK